MFSHSCLSFVQMIQPGKLCDLVSLGLCRKWIRLHCRNPGWKKKKKNSFYLAPLLALLFVLPSLVVLTTALHAPPLCPPFHFHSGFPTAVSHSSFSSHNHGGPVVWQDVEDESVSSGAGWAPSPGGIPTRSPPDRFDESPIPLYSRRKSWGFNQTHHCSIFQRSWRRTVGHFTNERCDISTSTSAQLNLTGCRCDSSFCSVDKVNRIQWWRKYYIHLLLQTNNTVK